MFSLTYDSLSTDQCSKTKTTWFDAGTERFKGPSIHFPSTATNLSPPGPPLLPIKSLSIHFPNPREASKGYHASGSLELNSPRFQRRLSRPQARPHDHFYDLKVASVRIARDTGIVRSHLLSLCIQDSALCDDRRQYFPQGLGRMAASRRVSD
ncbi:hypothetical protein ARMSODRAFT_351205 [Armillaria solidipes]|uniref:Uncharacterized protein n=1 Tax=Armillaria solidipes TaxID=1076256 RepID=A0A2H3B6K9_9AGAR|nr:hypothetical protein ARMSODRAFT_351205 [Armillaria solidipes]